MLLSGVIGLIDTGVSLSLYSTYGGLLEFSWVEVMVFLSIYPVVTFCIRCRPRTVITVNTVDSRCPGSGMAVVSHFMAVGRFGTGSRFPVAAL